MTYMVDGRQYIIVAVSGGELLRGVHRVHVAVEARHQPNGYGVENFFLS